MIIYFLCVWLKSVHNRHIQLINSLINQCKRTVQLNPSLMIFLTVQMSILKMRDLSYFIAVITDQITFLNSRQMLKKNLRAHKNIEDSF